MQDNKYSFHLSWSEEDQVYYASCPEFPGLLVDGQTPDEAIKEAQLVLQGMIEVFLEDGEPLPMPLTRQQYSGQFRVRIPKSLHRRAAEAADRDNVSLNAFVLSAIAEKERTFSTAVQVTDLAGDGVHCASILRLTAQPFGVSRCHLW